MSTYSSFSLTWVDANSTFYRFMNLRYVKAATGGPSVTRDA